jgi:RNA polymerase sigma-70 factor (ECF subfamily)
MAAFQEGEQDAFAELYDRYARALLNYFHKMCFDRTLAEDLMQDTFLKVLRFRGRWRPDASFRTFLYTVATNHWIDHYRSRKAAPKAVSAELRPAEDGATIGDRIEGRELQPLRRLEDLEAAALVRGALEQLPEAQRLVFLLAEMQGLKYREIAEVVGVPVGTVKSRMNAAITRLRGLLAHALQ